jgi:hypothetical protein
MKGCLRFYIFIFWISPNLAKYTFRILTFEQHCKIEKNKLGVKHDMSYEGFFFHTGLIKPFTLLCKWNWNKFAQICFSFECKFNYFAKICKNSPNFLYHKIINNFIKKEKPLIVSVVMGATVFASFFPLAF